MIDSYDKLTIKKYRELVSIEKGEDEMEYGVDILSVLSDMEQGELMEMPLDKFTNLMAKTKFLSQPIERVDYKKLGKRITVNGNEYRLIKNAKDLTAGQYIDYKAYVSRENFLEMLPYILTIFLIPEGKKYNDGYDITELAKEFDENMGLPIALGISDFFWHQSLLSTKSSILYLKWKMKRMMKKEKNPEMREQLTMALEQVESLQSLLNHSDGFIPQ